MIRGIKVVIIAFFSRFFLKKLLYRHNYLSMSMIVIGIFLVGLSTILASNGANASVLGVILLVIS